MKLRAPYQTRSIRFQRVADYQGWKIKCYEITRPIPLDTEKLSEAQLEGVLGHLPQPAVSESHHGVGLLIVHYGEHRIWLLLDWWYDQEILKQRLFSAPLDDPTQISEAEPELMACTWELAVLCFEQQAWLKTVLQNPGGPDLAAYLEKRLDADV